MGSACSTMSTDDVHQNSCGYGQKFLTDPNRSHYEKQIFMQHMQMYGGRG